MAELILTPNPLLLSTPTLETISLSSDLFGDAKVFVSPSIDIPGKIIPPTMMDAKILTSPFNLGSSVLLTSDIVIPSFNIISTQTYRTPLFYFDDVCNTSNIKEDIVKIFYYKFLDKWLYDDDASMYLLKYLKVSGNKVELVSNKKNTDDYLKNNQEVIDKKVDFIEHNLFSKEELYEILKKFVSGTHISWCDLTKHKLFVREAIEKTLEKKMKRLMSE
jgi:hypothetical protein